MPLAQWCHVILFWWWWECWWYEQILLLKVMLLVEIFVTLCVVVSWNISWLTLKSLTTSTPPLYEHVPVRLGWTCRVIGTSEGMDRCPHYCDFWRYSTWSAVSTREPNMSGIQVDRHLSRLTGGCCRSVLVLSVDLLLSFPGILVSLPICSLGHSTFPRHCHGHCYCHSTDRMYASSFYIQLTIPPWHDSTQHVCKCTHWQTDKPL